MYFDPKDLPEHSPLGASGASRWIKCPGSVGLSQGIVEDDSEHASLGTAAHALGEYCLSNKTEAWMHIGCPVLWEGGGCLDGSGDNIPEDAICVDKPMADAVQVYVDSVNRWHPDRNQGNSWVERGFHCPTIHPLFYGRSDFVYLDEEKRELHVWDYKHGAGVVVEVENNPQGMYYACGILEDLDIWEAVDNVVIHIAQPRAWHLDGPLRYWSVSTSDLVAWLEDECIPAMNRALSSDETASGMHCRFCPARSRACPQLLGDMEELRIMTKLLQNADPAKPLTDEQISRFLELFDISKIVAKAAEKTAFERLMAGRRIPGRKLVKARANREWKDGADMALTEKFGKEAWKPQELKSPAQIEELPEGKTFTARYAHKPDKGLTVGKGEDTRPAVNRDTKSMFQPVGKGKKK